MKMFIATLVLLFILRIRFPIQKFIVNILRQRYNGDTIKIYRRYEATRKKLAKNRADQRFLHACKAYKIIPKFIRFKLYKRSLYSTPMYAEWTNQLLDLEIADKKKQERQLVLSSQSTETELGAIVSGIDLKCISIRVSRNNERYINSIERVHERKLQKLGAHLNLSSADPGKVVHKHSDYQLSVRENYILSLI